MTIQRRSQRVHSEETEKFSSNEPQRINHLPKSQTEFVGIGYSTKKDPQLQMRGVEQWLSWPGDEEVKSISRAKGPERESRRRFTEEITKVLWSLAKVSSRDQKQYLKLDTSLNGEPMQFICHEGRDVRETREACDQSGSRIQDRLEG
jgi:hypothetical protein